MRPFRYIRRTLRSLLAALPLAAALPAMATVPLGYVSITGSNVVDSTGLPEASGTIYFTPVSNSGSPLSYRIGGVGQAMQSAVSAQVTSGAFTIQVADTMLTSPQNICYSVTIVDNVSGNSILGPGYSCVQPAGSGTAVTGTQAWCTAAGISGGTCNFDNYTPNLAALVAVQTGPAGSTNSLAIGTVTQAAAGGSAAATITGSAPAQTLNLTLPTGQQGPQGNTGAGQLTAVQVMPDTLAAPTTAYATQATNIATGTLASHGLALTAINNSLLSLQAALQNNGIIIPNALQTAIANCANCGVYPFNPTGAAVGPTTVSDVLATGNTATFGYTPATGGPNFVPGGRGPGQWGYIQGSGVGNGPVVAVPAPSIAGAATISQGQLTITSTSQVQGGGALTTYLYPVPTASTTGFGTLVGTSGGSISVVSMATGLSCNAGGVCSSPSFAYTMVKAAEWEVGNGVCAEYNTGTSAYVSFTFPASYLANGASTPGYNSFNVTTLVDHGNGTFTCYLNDGYGTYASSLQTATTSATSTFKATAVDSGAGYYLQSFTYLPGIQLTQPQVAGLVCGFVSTGNCGNWQFAPNAWTSNPFTSLSSQPSVDWQTHVFTGATGGVLDPFLHDCPYFTAYTNGALAGTGSYNGTWSHCHAVFSTNAPSIRASTVQGLCQSSGCPTNGFSVHVDGVLASYAGLQSSSGASYLNAALPNDGAFHTVDVSMGASLANTFIGYSPAQQYASLSGFFLRDVAILNNQQYQMLSVAQTGTTTICITDSILCSGFNTLPFSGMDSFLPMWRYGTSPPTPNIAAIGAGGFLLSTDFDPATSPTAITTAGGGSGYPTAQATTWVANNVTPLATGGTASNVTTALIARGINDLDHLASVFGTSTNCIGIEASSLKNILAALKAYNSGMTIHLFSLLNNGAYAESATDTCTGDSYTTTTSLTAYELVSGVWTPTVVSAGTVISGASSSTKWRIMQQDICLTLGSCDYFEVGPGAAGITVGSYTYYPPDLSGKLSTGTVVAGGTGYVTGDSWCPTQTAAYGGCFTVTASSGAITALALKTSGRNFATASALSGTTSGSGTGATANITAVAGAASDMNSDSLHPTALGHYELAQYIWAKYYSTSGWTFKQFN